MALQWRRLEKPRFGFLSPRQRELSLILRFDVSEMYDCHTLKVQEEGNDIVFRFN